MMVPNRVRKDDGKKTSNSPELNQKLLFHSAFKRLVCVTSQGLTGLIGAQGAEGKQGPVVCYQMR